MAKKRTTKPVPAEFKDMDVLGRKVDSQEVERFLARVKELGLGSHDLAERVRELFEDLADSVNSEDYGGGIEEQAAFLVKEEGDWEESLRTIAGLKKPPAPKKKPAAKASKRGAKPRK